MFVSVLGFSQTEYEPANVKREIKYDPLTGKYILYETVGDTVNLRPPQIMTLDQYLEYQRQVADKEHWRNRIDQNTGDDKSGKIIPDINIKGKFFETLFGSNKIQIRPQGVVELAFGVNSSRYDNPQLPENQRRVTRFDFQQRIQMNVVGQIGEKLKISAAYNTEATFDFENNVKVEYTGFEDEIIQKIEAGNVSLPLNSTLITGAQSLFGVKTELKFGRLRVSGLFSQNKGQKSEINLTGSTKVQDFEVDLDQYEANRHYFLNFYHRDHYDSAMASLPNVAAEVNITRIEVWVTNRSNTTTDNRNFIAFTDLGEPLQQNWQGNPGNNAWGFGDLPDNQANALYAYAAGNPNIRGFSNAVQELSSQVFSPGPFQQAVDYEKVENAKKLSSSEYTYNQKLGFVSLNQPLNNDEVLGIAYEYTYLGKTYQVGEFSTDGFTGQEALVLKLLKPTITNPTNKLWDLMMKNVYSIGAYQVNSGDFELDLFYNNRETSTWINYLPYPGVDDVLLLKLVSLDNINQYNEQVPDGRFDFAPMNFQQNKGTTGGTINPKNGRVFFTKVEPFGQFLYDTLVGRGVTSSIIDRVVFSELYDSTKTAAQQITGKNRFKIKGSYKSSVSSEISLNQLNIPEGSVVVTAGGVRLNEGTDYTVDYNLGRVKILNTGILESNTPIKIEMESNSLFGFQSKSLLGTRLEYRINKDFSVGGTWMNMIEKPLTQKVNVGDEPYSNHHIGFDVNYRGDAPFLTKMVDALPFISTKEKSSITFNGEFAHLISNPQRAIRNSDDRGTAYIDDFEGSQSAIDIRSYTMWRLASVPQGQTDLFPESGQIGQLSAGFNRALLAWYTIDPLFYQNSSLQPDHLQGSPVLEDSRQRLLLQDELFPQQQLPTGALNNIPVLDLAFYPKERGMYNYDSTFVDADGRFINPEQRWGGIMRALNTTDFETANIEFIQFWMLDPFNQDATVNETDPERQTSLNGGDLYFNLGNVSEDILLDSRKSFENGLPPNTDTTGIGNQLDTTNWARISTQQVVVNAFDNDPNARLFQDIGLDGWNNNDENIHYAQFVNWAQNAGLNQPAIDAIIADPSSDNYNYYRDDNYDALQLDILNRYKRFNGHEGNSASSEFSSQLNADGYPTQATNTPDIEDINADNNLSESEQYFQYRVSIRPGEINVGQNYVTNKTQVTKSDGTIENWYQFKIPVREPDRVVNGIQDFRSIRFMRMFVRGFDSPVMLRFAKLEMIRSEWRKYNQELLSPGEDIQGDPNSTVFNVGAVNLEENYEKQPVPYRIPPGINRQLDGTSTNLRQLNEQSMTLEVCGLQDGDARMAYKNLDLDIRSYEKLKLFVHGEQPGSDPLNNDDLTVFVRLGTDFNENYYEYEIPLKISPNGTQSETEIWPVENFLEISFAMLKEAKKTRNQLLNDPSSGVSLASEYVFANPNNATQRIKLKGSPNLEDVKTVMIGVRNPRQQDNNPWKPDDGLPKCAEIWVNEMRLTDFDQKGGSAALARLQVQMADFANISLAGTYYGVNWGAIDSRVSERLREEQVNFDLATNFQLGKFFGKKAAIQLPLFFGYSVGMVNPEYDPLNPDIKLKEYSVGEKKAKAKLARDFTQRTSVNLTNIRRERKAGKKVMPWDVENLMLNFSYNRVHHREFDLEYDNNTVWKGGINYTYNASPKLWEPFKKMKKLRKSKWAGLVRDFNLYKGIKLFAVRTEVTRSYNERRVRNVMDTNFVFQPTYLKNFTWTRNWDFKYDITKNLKFDFNSHNNSVFIEPEGMIDKKEDPDNYRVFQDTIKAQLKHGGTAMNYGHNVNMTWNVPFNRLPLTDWISGNFRYGGGYEWARSPLGQTELGHTIQNNRNFSINGQLNMMTLYNKIGFFKRINQQSRGRKVTKPAKKKDDKKDDKKKGKKDKDDKKKKKKNNGKVHPALATLGRLIMVVRNVSGTYTVSDGTLLPGYNQLPSFLGFNGGFKAPTFGFLFGEQDKNLWGQEKGRDFARTMSDGGWLVENRFLNKQMVVNHSQNMNFRATLEPFKDLRIDLTMDRNYSENENQYYRFNDTIQDWQVQNPVQTGNLSFSTIAIATSFATPGGNYDSKIFDALREDRLEVSRILAAANPNSTGFDTETGYYDGYTGEQQEVVVGAFLSAYTGINPTSKNVNPFKAIPLPNWAVTYDGLSKFKFMKKVVKNFTLNHRYTSAFTMSNFTTNLNAVMVDGNATTRDVNDNFINDRQVTNIVISEQFGPLIGLDATWLIKGKNGSSGLITKFEWKKDRTVSLGLANNQVTEVKGNEFVIGAGYKFPSVKMPFKLFGKRPESALNLRFDMSIRDNVTVIRKIVENTNQITAGQNLVSIKFAADYNLGQNLNIQFYYNQNITKPKVSTSYPTSNIDSGIKLTFNLAE
jgi:cell surface protein SprA